MKVPTYRAQTRMTAEVGGRPMRLRATSGVFGADAARAMGQVGRQVSDVAFGLEMQRQREAERQRIEDEREAERQRRIAEKEAEIDQKIKEGRFKVQYTEAIGLAAEEAAQQPESEQEAFYDNAIANIRAAIPEEFDDPIQQQIVDLDVEAYAATKRVGVRRNANQSRINAAMSVFAQQEQQFINQAIYGETATERVTAENNLSRLYEREGSEYFTAFDLERRSGTAQSKISFEREVLRLREVQSPEQAQAYIDNIQKNPPAGLDPTDVERLIAKAEGELVRKTQVVASLRDDLKGDIRDASSIIERGTLIPQDTLDEMAKRVITLQDEGINEQYNRMLEANQNMKVLQGMTPAAIRDLIDLSKDAPTEGFDLDTLRKRTQFQETASSYLQNMESAFERGEVLDFLNETGVVSVKEFDVSDFSGSIDRRLADIRQAKPYVYDERMGFTYEANFFTKQEAQAVTRYINQATPEEKALIALEMQKASSKAPQVWEQIAGKGGKLFAMAGAIGDIPTAETIFQGDALLRNKTATNPSSQDYMSAFFDYVGDTYRRPGTSGEDESLVMNAVLAHYAATRSDPVEFSEDEFVASIDAVTGGIGEYNGYRFELPRGMDPDDFRDIIDEMNTDMLKALAPEGVMFYTDEQAVRTIQKSRLINSGVGGYYVVDPGTNQVMLFDKNQQPLEIRITQELLDYVPSDMQLRGPVPEFRAM